MPDIEQGVSDHSFLIERRRILNPYLRTLYLEDEISSRSFSYRKLPPQLFNLTVLKLDGSSFDVNVSKHSTVAELKQAIEEVFSWSPRESDGKISWSHVWGHFCLRFQGRNLINDKASLRNFGIRDGDQLQFIRHMSINCEPIRSVSRTQADSCKQKSMLSLGSNDHIEEEQTCENESVNHEGQEDYYKNTDYEDDDDEIPIPEFKLAHFLRGWLSYSRLWSGTRKQPEARMRPSRFSLQCLGG